MILVLKTALIILYYTFLSLLLNTSFSKAKRKVCIMYSNCMYLNIIYIYIVNIQNFYKGHLLGGLRLESLNPPKQGPFLFLLWVLIILVSLMLYNKCKTILFILILLYYYIINILLYHNIHIHTYICMLIILHSILIVIAMLTNNKLGHHIIFYDVNYTL